MWLAVGFWPTSLTQTAHARWQLLVRHLCDRLEHQCGISYWDGQQNVVDERTQEVLELEEHECAQLKP